MITEEENKKIEEMVIRAIPYGEQCVWKKEHEKVRREALKKRISDLLNSRPYQPQMEQHFKPNLEYK